jgi:hypothetical protein
MDLLIFALFLCYSCNGAESYRSMEVFSITMLIPKFKKLVTNSVERSPS